MISNWPFLPPARISRTVLAATLDLPTILPLKASFESGSTPKEVTITSNSTVEKKKETEEPQPGDFIGEKRDFPMAAPHLFIASN